jgi:putative transcriptional regulator
MGRTKPIRCRIPELVHKLGKKQQWLADESGYSKQRISDICKMRYIPELEVLHHIASIIGCTSDELYEWSEG